MEFIKGRFPEARPKCALMLGSGWNSVASIFTVLGSIKYSAIPGMGRAGVAGHIGELAWCSKGKTEFFVFKGRRHWYEGAGWEPVVLPAFIARAAGAEILIITNASGGINPGMKPGSLMIIDDHINMIGSNPLIGAHNEYFGARFPDQTGVYDARLRNLMLKVAGEKKIKLYHGIYAALSGPVYETPAEIKMLKIIGADAVGMSTVPEATAANAIGLKILGLSCITNAAAGISGARLGHDEVQASAVSSADKIKTLLNAFFKELKNHE